MSGSETGLMATREPYNSHLQKASLQSQPGGEMRISFNHDGTAVYRPINSSSSPTYHQNSAPTTTTAANSGGGIPGFNMNMESEPMKRKRGRPRKYGPDSSVALAIVPAAVVPATAPVVAQPVSAGVGGGFSSPPTSAPPLASLPSPPPPPPPPPSSVSAGTVKKSRGRPPGSCNRNKHQPKHMQLPDSAMGSTGLAFTPHVITVRAGEDVSAKILALAQSGPRDICVLSANGTIAAVTLQQPAASGGTQSYEGKYELLSLSGSFLLNETGGLRTRTGNLTVSLSAPDGRILGGGVGGVLIAANPVQVVLGSFIHEGHKEPKLANNMEPTKFVSSGGPSSPQSRGTLSESSGGPGSPLNQTNNTNHQNMPWK